MISDPFNEFASVVSWPGPGPGPTEASWTHRLSRHWKWPKSRSSSSSPLHYKNINPFLSFVLQQRSQIQILKEWLLPLWALLLLLSSFSFFSFFVNFNQSMLPWCRQWLCSGTPSSTRATTMGSWPPSSATFPHMAGILSDMSPPGGSPMGRSPAIS